MELSQDTLLAILAAVLIADVVVVVVALVWTQVQKRRNRDEVPAPVSPAAQAPDRTMSGATAVMSRPFPTAAAPSSTSGSYAAGAPAFGHRARVRPDWVPPAATRRSTRSPGCSAPGAWSRTVVDEEASIRRYHRPATVVVIEVEGLERLVSRLGPSSVDRIVPAVGDTIRRGAREADHVARLATGRFGVLMPETDEILAINFIERVRKACDLWLESGAVSLRLAIGWASSTGDGSLVDAEALATDRMYGELRRVTRNSGDGGAGLPGWSGRRGRPGRRRRVQRQPGDGPPADPDSRARTRRPLPDRTGRRGAPNDATWVAREGRRPHPATPRSTGPTPPP